VFSLFISQSLLSDTGYLKEDDKMMDTEDGVTLEEDLLETENNREINPHHDLKDQDKYGEARKQDKQPARETEGDNARRHRHKNTPT